MLWVEFGCANGLRPLVVGLWWLGCWGGRHQRGWGGLWQRFCGGFRSGLMFGLRFRLGLLGWWVLATILWRFCGGFWLRFCGGFMVGIGCDLCHGFFFFIF